MFLERAYPAFLSRDVLFEYQQLFLLVEQLDQLEVCLTYSRLLAGIPILNTGGIPKFMVEFK